MLNHEKMKLKLILLAFLTLGIYTANACSCQSSDDLQDEYKWISTIVHGKVLTKSYVSYESTLTTERLKLIQKEYESDYQKLNALKLESIIKVELEVYHIYKGTGIKDKIVIYTSRHGASCGYLDFEIGKEFIIYLSPKSYLDVFYKVPGENLRKVENNEAFWTNQCRRTRMFDKKEDKELRSLRTTK